MCVPGRHSRSKAPSATAVRAGSTLLQRSASWSSCWSRVLHVTPALPRCMLPPSRGTAPTRSPASDMEPASTFPQLLAEVVGLRADHDALIYADEVLSYAELDRRTARMARALLAVGAGKG